MGVRGRVVGMGFTCGSFPEGTHMCLIYDDEEQRLNIISKFIESGLVSRERVGYFADETEPERVYEWLEESGVDTSEPRQDGRFQVLAAEDVYCPDGEFVPEKMLGRLRAGYDDAIGCGCPGIRVSGEMSWALRGLPGCDRLMEYEALVNDVVSEYPVTAVCQYDARRFDGATILNVHRVHPMMIVGGQIVRNPYYMRPQEFLKDRPSTALNREDARPVEAVWPHGRRAVTEGARDRGGRSMRDVLPSPGSGLSPICGAREGRAGDRRGETL